MPNRFKLNSILLILCMAGAAPSLAADDATTLTTQSSTMDQLSSQQSSGTVTTKFAGDFAEFSGSQENAEALITGLRNGAPIVLTGTSTGSGTTDMTTTITPPTKPMGYGNTYISLSLAKAQLAQYGITEPTPEQLEAALTGGTFTTTTVAANGTLLTKTVTLDGILTQRASGLGWGQIAQANGFKLGQVISGMKSANKSMASLSPQPSKFSGTSATATGKSIKSAETSSAKTKYSGSSRSITTALSGGGVVYGKSHAKAATISTGGSQHGSGHGNSQANGHGQGAAAAARVSSTSIVTAAGGGAVHGNSANAAGHAKGPK